MSKRNREGREREAPGGGRPPMAPGGGLGWATLIGIGAVLVVSLLSWTATRKLDTSLSARLGQLDSRLTQLSAKVDAVRAPQQQRGPDPNKVYSVKTDGAPSLGPSTAPVIIAEVSDFQ